MDALLTQLCIRVETTNQNLADISKRMDLIQTDFKTCIVNQGRENAMIEALSRVNDTLIATNIDLRKRLGEYNEAPPPAPEGNLVLSNHDEQNLIITGKTYDFKDLLKQNFSVSWNSSPKGWLCPIAEKDAIVKLCTEKKIECQDNTTEMECESPPESPNATSAAEAVACLIR